MSGGRTDNPCPMLPHHQKHSKVLFLRKSHVLDKTRSTKHAAIYTLWVAMDASIPIGLGMVWGPG